MEWLDAPTRTMIRYRNWIDVIQADLNEFKSDKIIVSRRWFIRWIDVEGKYICTSESPIKWKFKSDKVNLINNINGILSIEYYSESYELDDSYYQIDKEGIITFTEKGIKVIFNDMEEKIFEQFKRSYRFASWLEEDLEWEEFCILHNELDKPKEERC